MGELTDAYRGKASSRIITQHADKPKLVALVDSLCNAVSDHIESPLEDLITIYDIDNASGYLLDLIGDLVGQPREIVSYENLTFFGFEGDATAGTFGDLYNAQVGSRLISSGEDSLVESGRTTLLDPEYRLFIKLKILRNYTISTREDVIEAFASIFPDQEIGIEEGYMSIVISIDGDIDQNTVQLIIENDLAPRPSGVEILSIESYNTIASDDNYDIALNDGDVLVYE